MNWHLRNSLLLCLLTLGVYAQTFLFGFVTVDDPSWITENPFVNTGVNLVNLRWAFGFDTIHEHANWVPLTFLSLMIDAQLFGMEGGGFHLTNVALHCCSALFLYGTLFQMTGAPTKSALVAALFAVHPLHVESVAWATERKDVLSLFFGHAAIWAYVLYSAGGKKTFYLTSFVLFLCSLLSKQTLVTLPFLLLLLDYWPLCRGSAEIESALREVAYTPRFSPASRRRLIVEKIPFLMLTILFCWLALRAQQEPMHLSEQFSMPYRAMNAVTSYVEYVGKTFWPMHLSVFYPHREISTTAGILNFVVLVSVCALAVVYRRSRPYVFTGWFWFLGTLVPVIGLVQIGMQRMADRYTYAPLTGLFLLTVWLIDDLVWSARLRRSVLPVSSVIVVLLLTVFAFRQTALWNDSISLYRDGLAATEDNGRLQQMLAVALCARGDAQSAFPHFAESARLQPKNYTAYTQWGQCLMEADRNEEAVQKLTRAIEIFPNAPAYYSLGKIWESRGRFDLARDSYRAAIEADSEYVSAHYNLGVILLNEGRLSEAISEFEQTLAINPRHVFAHNNLGVTYLLIRKLDPARFHFEEALRLDPQLPQAKQGLMILDSGQFPRE